MWYVYTKEHYLAIKRNKMSYAATWMEPEMIILSKVSHRNTNTIRYHLHVESKIQVNIPKKQTDSQLQRTD